MKNTTASRHTVIEHIASPKRPAPVTSYQVSGLALELSRKADGTIDLLSFEDNCHKAFNILAEIQVRIERQPNNSPF